MAETFMYGEYRMKFGCRNASAKLDVACEYLLRFGMHNIYFAIN